MFRNVLCVAIEEGRVKFNADVFAAGGVDKMVKGLCADVNADENDECEEKIDFVRVEEGSYFFLAAFKFWIM